MKLISTEFMLFVTIANLIAWPAVTASVIIALLTVSYHSLKAANTNPVKALKYE